ncbi:MAG: lysophospholipid acyltransferase family protein [Pseudomonadota bacterium]
MSNSNTSWSDWLENLAARGALGLGLLLPYRWRVPAMGWVMARIIAPVAGLRGRIRDNLAFVLPDLPEATVDALQREVPDNMGRTLIEVYSGSDFYKHCESLTLGGPGWPAVAEARDTGRPVLIVSAHFGNYDALRVALIQAGCNVGAIYRPFNNPYFDAHYRKTISRIGPIFARGSRGAGEMVHHIRNGGMAAIAADQWVFEGAPLTFFDKPASTATSAARLALKYDALLVAGYGVRKDDGLDFDLVIEAPIPHTTVDEMSQALNDSLEAQVRAHLGQWMWTHRRWKA